VPNLSKALPGVVVFGCCSFAGAHAEVPATPPAAVASTGVTLAPPAAERERSAKDAGRRLLAAYPDKLAAIDGQTLVWRDGTRMPLDDGLPLKKATEWLQSPDLKDMFRYSYDNGDLAIPMVDQDPGRARNRDFFTKLYGNCQANGVASKLVDVAWLPSRSPVKLKATTENGVAAQLAKVSAELDALPTSFTRYLLPPAGTYNCRAIAGSDQQSAHGYGIAIDLAVKPAHYWRWSKPDASGNPIWRNAIPMEIVRIFEHHGFIWGGRWAHYDTMHFEYRPELLLP
jgi:D-alanyl-D-alanine carboxypeptidase